MSLCVILIVKTDDIDSCVVLFDRPGDFQSAVIVIIGNADNDLVDRPIQRITVTVRSLLLDVVRVSMTHVALIKEQLRESNDLAKVADRHLFFGIRLLIQLLERRAVFPGEGEGKALIAAGRFRPVDRLAGGDQLATGSSIFILKRDPGAQRLGFIVPGCADSFAEGIHHNFRLVMAVMLRALQHNIQQVIEISSDGIILIAVFLDPEGSLAGAMHRLQF